jgi:hypothetical protein
MNMVERFFRNISGSAQTWRVVQSVDELVCAIEALCTRSQRNPNPSSGRQVLVTFWRIMRARQNSKGSNRVKHYTSFTHTPQPISPWSQSGCCHRQSAVGSAFGHTSPVATLAPTLYLDVTLPAGQTLTLGDRPRPRHLPISGEVPSTADAALEVGCMCCHPARRR